MQFLTTPHARRCLTWCLVALLPWLGLGIAQRQTLGPLHVHAATAELGVQQGSDLLRDAVAWWWAQVQAQTHARQHARAHAHGQTHAHAGAAVHAHDAWQRHHHGGDDASVIALDTPGDGQGSPGAGALLLLPVLGSPQGGLLVEPGTAPGRAWPRPGSARFSSWGMPPPLQPPRG